MQFCIADKWPCIYGVANFLLVQSLAGNVDGLEPLQFLRFLTLAHIHCEFVIKNPLLNVGWLIEEVLEIISKLSCHILT